METSVNPQPPFDYSLSCKTTTSENHARCMCTIQLDPLPTLRASLNPSWTGFHTTLGESTSNDKKIQLGRRKADIGRVFR
jgi:hypothetical protein